MRLPEAGRSKRRLLAFAAACGLVAGPAPAQRVPDWAALPSTASDQLSDHRRITAALAALKPQRRGVVDAYVLVVALDADPVFGREAREAGRVLARRFDAAGRTLVLAGDEGADKAAAAGSPHHLALGLARAAELMDRDEDVLVLYSTGHGTANRGLNYKDMSRGVGLITPLRFAQLLDPLGFRNRLIVLQACYSGQFIPVLEAPRTVVATAAAEDRSSFGCTPGNDWTFFGHALVNRAMRKPASFAEQFNQAAELIAGWEAKSAMVPSNPQIRVGSEAGQWLSALDARSSKAVTAPVGRPPSEIVD
jgi:hypothetical protein